MADEFDQGRYAYVTLLSTENYLDAVLVLNKSLKNVHAQYPLLVMVVDTIFTPTMKEIFHKNGIVYETVPPLEYSQFVKDKYQERENKNVLNTASKIQLFTLKNWDKLVYLDADVLVLQNIDDLFSRLDGSMIKYAEDQMGFSGMFVFEPRNHQEDEFYPTIMQAHACVDGDLIGKVWFFVRESKEHQIDPKYFWHYNPHMTPSDAKVVHFCNHIKPWLEPQHEIFADGSYVNHLYQKFLKEVQQEKIKSNGKKKKN